MSVQLSEGCECSLTACLPKGGEFSDTGSVVFGDFGAPVVYKRRWLILAAFSFGYFSWNLHTLKHIAIVAEYAEFYDTTNEFSPGQGEFGVDGFTIADGVFNVIFYPLAGQLIDKFGLSLLTFGAILQALSAWWYYLSFQNYASALASRILASAGGTLISTSFLSVTTKWFPLSERAIAIGIGVIVSELGAGMALLVGEFFYLGDGEPIFDATLKSCKDSFIDSIENISAQVCSPEAEENFCCRIPTNLNGVNFLMPIVTTIAAIFAIAVVRNNPPTPPSRAGKIRQFPGFWNGMKLMFRHWNYNQICLVDFIMSGPPQALFAALSRIFPPRVEGFDFIAGAAGLAVSIPAAIIFSWVLSRTKWYYGLTAGAYTSGGIFWLVATICLAIDTEVTDYIFLVLAAGALVTLVLWTVSVYELKLEYVFHRDFNLEGFVVGVDRTVINLSGALFTAAIPPERYTGDNFPGRLFTFYSGLAFMIFGVILVLTVRNRFNYKRLDYERERKRTMSLFLEGDDADLKINEEKKKEDEAPSVSPTKSEEMVDEV